MSRERNTMTISLERNSISGERKRIARERKGIGCPLAVHATGMTYPLISEP